MSQYTPPQQRTAHLLLHLWRHLNPHRRLQVCALSLVMLASGVAEMISLASVIPLLAALTEPERLWSLPIGKFLSSIFELSTPRELLLPVCIIFAVAIILATSVRILNLWLNGRLAAAIGSDLSYLAYRCTLYQPYSYHVQHNSSSIIATVNGHVGTTVAALNSALQLFTSTLVAISLLSILLLVDAQIACLTGLVLGTSYLLLAILTRKRLATNGHIVAETSKHLIKSLQEGLGAIRDVILDGSQSAYLNIHSRADRSMRLKQAQNNYISSFPRYALEAIGMLSISLASLLLTWQRGDTYAVIPLLGTLALGAQRLLPALQQIYFSWAIVQTSGSSINKVLNTIELPYTSTHYLPNTKAISLSNSIELCSVEYAYPSSGLILKGINLEIYRGERIGIIGTTGSGKSTLVDVIMGLLEPTSGMVKVDGVHIYGEHSHEASLAWMSAVAHVPQNIYLTDNSIAENIAFGTPSSLIDMQMVKTAAEQAQISDFVESLPSQYNSFVGERGIRISGGQRQRIGIARALYKKASILIFDEATSALDNTTEEAVMNSINTLSRDLTIIMIAHRLTTIERCDRVIELKDGLIVSETTGKDLRDRQSR